jgi:hypothetical protein
MNNIDIIPCAIYNKNKQIISNPITCQFESRKMFGKIFSTNNKNKQIIYNPITCQFESRKMFGKIFSTVL